MSSQEVEKFIKISVVFSVDAMAGKYWLPLHISARILGYRLLFRITSANTQMFLGLGKWGQA